MNWTNGKSYMEIKSFTADELCKIIKECAKSYVKTLKFSDEAGDTIHLEFVDTENVPNNLSPNQARVRKGAFPAPKNLNDVAEIEAFSLEQKLMAQEQERIDNLLLEDPLQYEEEVARGAIEHDTEQEE